MIKTIREHTFFPGPLRPGSSVLDLGANRGDFALEVTRRYPVACVAVEPTAALAESISGAGIRVRRLAISARPGEVRLYVADNPEASSIVVGAGVASHVETVKALTLSELLDDEQLEEVALAKVDIEGAERDLLLQTPPEVLRRCAQISVEFHVFTGALSDADVESIVLRLRQIGFESIRFSASHHNWLFFQPLRCEVGSTEILFTRYVVRNVRGLAVRAARRV